MQEIEQSVSGIPEKGRAQLYHRSVRQVYLLTYSQADMNRFPRARRFAEAVISAFKNTPAQILQWFCAKEQH